MWVTCWLYSLSIHRLAYVFSSRRIVAILSDCSNKWMRGSDVALYKLRPSSSCGKPVELTATPPLLPPNTHCLPVCHRQSKMASTRSDLHEDIVSLKGSPSGTDAHKTSGEETDKSYTMGLPTGVAVLHGDSDADSSIGLQEGGTGAVVLPWRVKVPALVLVIFFTRKHFVSRLTSKVRLTRCQLQLAATTLRVPCRP